MQSDEEVGKVAATVPVVISRVLEMFIENLLIKASSVTKARNAKVLTPSHVKQAVLNEKQFDFLKDIMAAIADVQQDNDESEAAPRPKGRPRKKPEENDGKAAKKAPKAAKPKRAAKAQASSDESEDSANDDDEDEEDEDEDDEAPRQRRQTGSSSRAAPPVTAVRSNLSLLADASASAELTDGRAGTSAASAFAPTPAGIMPPLVPIGTLPPYSEPNPYAAPHLYPGMSMIPPFIDPRLLPGANDMRAHLPHPWPYGAWPPTTSGLWPPPPTDRLPPPSNSHMLSVSRSDEGEEANSGVVDLSLMTPNRSKRRQEQADDNDYDAA